MMNKIFITILFLISFSNSFALIFDDIKIKNYEDGFLTFNKSKNLTMYINNKRLKVKEFFTDAHQGDVIGYYIFYAQENKFKIIENNTYLKLANYLINSDGNFKNFDYTFFIDDKNYGNLIVASTEEENKTKVIKLRIPAKIEKEFYIKKIKNLYLPENFKGVLNIKFIYENKENNFYILKSDYNNFDFIFSDWLKNLRKDGWKIKYIDEKEKFLFIKKYKNEFFLICEQKLDSVYLGIIY